MGHPVEYPLVLSEPVPLRGENPKAITSIIRTTTLLKIREYLRIFSSHDKF